MWHDKNVFLLAEFGSVNKCLCRVRMLTKHNMVWERLKTKNSDIENMNDSFTHPNRLDPWKFDCVIRIVSTRPWEDRSDIVYNKQPQ